MPKRRKTSPSTIFELIERKVTNLPHEDPHGQQWEETASFMRLVWAVADKAAAAATGDPAELLKRCHQITDDAVMARHNAGLQSWDSSYVGRVAEVARTSAATLEVEVAKLTVAERARFGSLVEQSYDLGVAMTALAIASDAELMKALSSPLRVARNRKKGGNASGTKNKKNGELNRDRRVASGPFIMEFLHQKRTEPGKQTHDEIVRQLKKIFQLRFQDNSKCNWLPNPNIKGSIPPTSEFPVPAASNWDIIIKRIRKKLPEYWQEPDKFSDDDYFRALANELPDTWYGASMGSSKNVVSRWRNPK